jgi:CYTH domain-containing protein
VKIAWPYPHDGRRYGIDAFEGALSGLILAEIEFQTEQAMRDAPPPPFACIEVTNRLEFTGGYLAGRSFQDLRPLVEELTAPLG